MTTAVADRDILVRRVAEMAGQGLEHAAIAARLAVPKYTVGRLAAEARRQGIGCGSQDARVRRSNDAAAAREARDAAIAAAWNAGDDRAALAKRFGLSGCTMRQIVSRLRRGGQLTRPDPAQPAARRAQADERHRQAVRLAAGGCGLPEIAIRLGLHAKTVGRILAAARRDGRLVPAVAPKGRTAVDDGRAEASRAARMTARAPTGRAGSKPQAVAGHVRPSGCDAAATASSAELPPPVALPPPVSVPVGGGNSLHVGRLEARMAAFMAGVSGRPRPAPSLLDLGPSQCRMPAGIDLDRGFGRQALFCGAPTRPGDSWCRACKRLAFLPRDPAAQARRSA